MQSLGWVRLEAAWKLDLSRPDGASLGAARPEFVFQVVP